ncbi:MAG TPA: alpha/beta hydrolase-fold protein [Sediminibacterium sp.]|nr:alpha/beta hydrolase-fold protein [Sediminibacterium sp.]
MKRVYILLLLIIFSNAIRAAVVDTVSINSASMKKSIKTVVIKPDAYSAGEQRFPVVYLLHGFGGRYNNWITRVPQLKQLADEMQLIIVCPDGAKGSWYFDSPVDSSYRYETFVGTEVPAFIDANYKTIADRKARAITGLSMGGHGGLFLGFRHADRFSACGSMSGALHVTVIRKGYEVEYRLGDTLTNQKYWNDWSVLNVIDQQPVAPLAIMIDCGTEDRILPMSRLVHEKMIRLKIPHDYTERPGNHDWMYWSNAVQYQLLYFTKHFKQQLSQF